MSQYKEFAYKDVVMATDIISLHTECPVNVRAALRKTQSLRKHSHERRSRLEYVEYKKNIEHHIQTLKALNNFREL